MAKEIINLRLRPGPDRRRDRRDRRDDVAGILISVAAIAEA